MARLYSNENFPIPAVEELRRLGHDVLTIQETGHANQASSDEAVLAFACDEHRALLTLNRKHFVRLHQPGVAGDCSARARASARNIVAAEPGR